MRLAEVRDGEADAGGAAGDQGGGAGAEDGVGGHCWFWGLGRVRFVRGEVVVGGGLGSGGWWG